MKRICDIILVSSFISAFVYCQQQTPQKQFQGRFQFGAGKVPANFDCPEDFGYYPHATDCTQYYVCVFGGALLESCSGGLVYSRELQTCDWPRNAGCNLTGESPVEKPAVSGFSTVRITDTRTEKTSSIPQAVTENSRRLSSIGQPQKSLGQEGFDSGFTLRPDNKESRLFRGDGRKIDSPLPRVQDVEERFTSTERLEEPRSGSRQGRRKIFEDYTDDQYSPGTSKLTNDTYDDYDEYGSEYSTSTWKTWNLNSDLSTTEKQPMNRRLPLSNFLNRAIHRQEPSQPKQNRWHPPQTFHGTNTRQSGPVPLPVHSRFSNPPHSENDRSWPISLRIPSQPPAPRPPPQAVERFNDWSPGFRIEQSLSDNWRHTQNYFAPAPPKTPSFHSSVPSSVFGPEATGRKVASHPSKSRTNFNAVTDRPLKTKQPGIDYTDYDYDSREIFEDNRRPTQQQRFPQQSFREETEFVPRPQAPPQLEPRPQFAPRPQEPPRIQLQPQEALKPSSPSPRPVESPVASSNAAAASEEIEEYYEYLYDEFGNPVFEEESGEVVAPSPQTTSQRPATTERTTTTTTKRPTTAFTTTTTTAATTTTERAEPIEPATGKGSKVRGQMKFSETSAASAGQRVPSQKSSKKNRPTLKPVGALVPSKIEPVDVNKFAPWRFAPVFETPEPDTPAEKCKSDVCQLPDCHCGGKEVPGGLEAENLPQIVLLTFDDSVNDLNKELYKDLFEKGRLNPNGCPIQATFYVSHEWTDYSQVQNLYADGHEIASHTVSHSFGEQFSTKKWARETAGQRDIMAAYAGVKAEDVRGMRAPFLSVGGNKMFKMLYDLNFTYDSSMPVYENNPPSYPYTLDYKIFHDCMIPPCPTRSYPGVWEVPMVMWQDLNGGRCSMGDGCSNPPDAEGIYKMLVKNFERHYTTNRAPFPLYYHAAWFTTPHHKEGFQAFLDTLVSMDDVWVVTNWQLIQWMREPTSLDKIKDFEPFKCSYPDRPKKCNNPKVCNLWHKSGVRYMKSCQPCPEAYPWTGKTGVKNSILEKYLADES